MSESAPGPRERRPGNLILVALVVCGLWPSLWFAAALLVPLSFWATWPGRWHPRHWVMAATGALWGAATAVSLAGSPERAKLGLGEWQPPGWMVDLGSGEPLLVLLVQAAAMGAFVLALWSRHPALSGGQPAA